MAWVYGKFYNDVQFDTEPLLSCAQQVFPDWFGSNTQSWWTEALKNWSSSGIEFSGIWLDMNEASTFCDGSW